MRPIRRERAVLLAALALVAGCKDITNGPVPAATSMQAATPTAIEYSIGQEYPTWMAVQVLDQYGAPVAGVPVTWTVTAGGGSVRVVEQQTNAEGVVHAYWKLGLRLDEQNRLQAAAEGMQPVVFTATPRYPDPGNVDFYTTITGGNQTGTVGAPTPQPIVVTLRTPGGQPAVGAPVTFAVSSGGGTVSPTSTKTDSAGQARATWTLGTMRGDQDLSVTVMGDLSLLRVKAVAGAPATVVVADRAAEYNLPSRGDQVGVYVADQYGNPVPNAAVNWAVTAGGGSASQTPTMTDTAGRAFTFWNTGSTEGVVERMTATVAGLPPVEFSTTIKGFFFSIISPPSPGPGATVTGNQLAVEAYTYPHHPLEAYRVPSFTLTVADRTVSFGPVAGPFRWRAVLSLAGLPAGTHTYHVQATDETGRTHNESVTFTYAP